MNPEGGLYLNRNSCPIPRVAGMIEFPWCWGEAAGARHELCGVRNTTPRSWKQQTGHPGGEAFFCYGLGDPSPAGLMKPLGRWALVESAEAR